MQIHHTVMWTCSSLHFPTYQADPCGSQGPRHTQQNSALQFWLRTDYVITTAILLNCDMAFGTFLWRETIKLVSMLHWGEASSRFGLFFKLILWFIVIDTCKALRTVSNTSVLLKMSYYYGFLRCMTILHLF